MADTAPTTRNRHNDNRDGMASNSLATVSEPDMSPSRTVGLGRRTQDAALPTIQHANTSDTDDNGPVRYAPVRGRAASLCDEASGYTTASDDQALMSDAVDSNHGVLDAQQRRMQNYHAYMTHQNIDDAAESPNEMEVDSDSYMDGINEKSEDDVAMIYPDGRADDHEFIKEHALPPLQDQPPILDETHHTWEIENWDQMGRREHGPIFYCGGQPWRVLFFPKGNNVDWCSFYLEHASSDEEKKDIDDDWSCCVQFGLVLWNPKAPWIYTHHTAHHRFTKTESDWGFTRFVELRKLANAPWEGNKDGHMLVEGFRANMTAYVRAVKDETGVLWHNFMDYDSKKETGYVGLKNQGATCYLNSLIQSLFFTNSFRRAVYHMPLPEETSEETQAVQDSAYSLQRLFYQLQISKVAVGTTELTKSFGWETRHIFEQQDVQELSRKLMEKLEESMKGTELEKFLPKLLCGKVRTYISCINVEYESRREEDFWDIQLNVSGNRNLEDSFRDYVQVEVMNGENQYFAGDQYKLQDAKKGVIFESFPEVLHLQLKRFQYDIDRDAMMKLNDRYEFPESFDAAPYLSEEADKSESWIYQLHSVLVHSGDLNAGHYYAYIRPEKDGWFYKYDDDRVTKATMREVLEENFGGEYIMANGEVARNKNKPIMRQQSAYMLVYVRQTRVDDVLRPIAPEDTPSHLQERLDREAVKREAARKEKEEAHLYLKARVVTDDTFRAYGGQDLTDFNKGDHDVNNPASPRYFKVKRLSSIQELTEKIGESISVDPQRLRLWCMVNRQNKTVRPDTPILDPSVTCEMAHSKSSGGNKAAELRVWAEVADEIDENGKAIWPDTVTTTNGALQRSSDLIVLFLKHFDVENQTLNGIGHIYISREKKVEDLVPVILKKMSWSPERSGGEKIQLKLFEEIKPAMIESMKSKQSLKAAELQDGDIICFQLASSENDLQPLSTVSTNGSTNSHRFQQVRNVAPPPDRYEIAPQFYDFLQHRKELALLPHPKTASPGKYNQFHLQINAKCSYDQLATRTGNEIGVDPTHIRFWTVAANNGQPKLAVKRMQNLNVSSILSNTYHSYNNVMSKSDSLYYEVLDMSLAEMDTKKVVRIVWLTEGISKQEQFDLLVPKSGNVQDLVDALIKKAQIDDEEKGGPIRIIEIHTHKVHKELPRNYGVMSITDSYVNLAAERVPEDEIGLKEEESITAFHYQNEPSKAHGIPFKFRMIPGEVFSDTKKRLEKRTGLKGKNFEKIKFSVVKRSSYSRPTPLHDDSILMDVTDADDDLLGLDHVDRSRAIRMGAGDLTIK